MCRIAIAARADVHANLATFVRGEALENLVVQFDETTQEVARGIKLERKPTLGEVDLDIGRARVECPADIRFDFVVKSATKSFPRIARYFNCRIQQTQS